MSALALTTPAGREDVKTLDQQVREILPQLLIWIANTNVPDHGISMDFKFYGDWEPLKAPYYFGRIAINHQEGVKDLIGLMERMYATKADWIWTATGYNTCHFYFSDICDQPNWKLEFIPVYGFGFKLAYLEIHATYWVGMFPQREWANAR